MPSNAARRSGCWVLRASGKNTSAGPPVAAEPMTHCAGVMLGVGPDCGSSQASSPMTPPVMPAMAAHSQRPSRLPRNFAPPISVSGSSKMMMMIWTAASWPVPSAVAPNRNDTSVIATAISQVRRRSRSRISFGRNSARAGSSWVALRFSTFEPALATAAKNAHK
jgi:hypothetical protein